MWVDFSSFFSYIFFLNHAIYGLLCSIIMISTLFHVCFRINNSKHIMTALDNVTSKKVKDH